MESEKVKEIKKVLKCIVNANVPKTEINYYGNLYVDILTLINELKSENDRLLEQRNKTYNIWVKDTEKLKDRIAELEKENKILRKHNIGYCVANNYEAQEQLKEFVERLKEKGKEIVTGESVDFLVELLRYSEELVKEYTNENGKV